MQVDELNNAVTTTLRGIKTKTKQKPRYERIVSFIKNHMGHEHSESARVQSIALY